MKFKTYTQLNCWFVDSASIEVFPTAYRGTFPHAVSEAAKPINVESRLQTEYNLTKGIVGNKKTFIKEWFIDPNSEETPYIIFYIDGYYFKITGFGLTNTQNINYAYIEYKNSGLVAGTQPDQNTPIIKPLYGTTGVQSVTTLNNILDIKLNNDGSGEDTYFVGLAFTTGKPSGPDKHYIQLKNNAGGIYYNNFLPNIYTGEVRDSIVLNSQENTAAGNLSVAEGYNTTANAFASHAEGGFSAEDHTDIPEHYTTWSNKFYIYLIKKEGTDAATGYFKYQYTTNNNNVQIYPNMELHQVAGTSLNIAMKEEIAATIMAYPTSENGMQYLLLNTENAIVDPELNTSNLQNATYSYTFDNSPVYRPIMGVAFGEFAHVEGLNNTAYGDYSHAEGIYTEAIADGAHAEGQYAAANNINAHAEGHLTKAYGTASHAEGGQTVTGIITNALKGRYAHAEGCTTKAFGEASHSEGYLTKAIGTDTHAEGYMATADGEYSHAEGQNTAAVQNATHAEGRGSKTTATISSKDNNIFTLECNSTIKVGQILVYEADDINRYYCKVTDVTVFTLPIQQVTVSGSYTSFPSTGTIYVRTGIAYGAYAHAEGYQTQAIGNKSHTEGDNTIAPGLASHAEGSETNANGKGSHAEGYQTLADKNYSHAEGSNTTAFGEASHVEGYKNYTINKGAHAEGNGSGMVTLASLTISVQRNSLQGTVTSNSSTWTNYIKLNNIIYFKPTNIFALVTSVDTADKTFTTDVTLAPSANITDTSGIYRVDGNIAYANGTHAEGGATKAIKENSHAEGDKTMAFGEASHAEGNYTQANGKAAHAEGGAADAGWATQIQAYTVANGDFSHAEGKETTTYGEASHTEGYNTQTGGDDISNTLTASNTTVKGAAAHAEGNATLATGVGSHAEGKQTFASGDYSHAEGNATSANGDYSHAEGWCTGAIGDCSHAEGEDTHAEDDWSHAEGHTTYAIGPASHAEGELTEVTGIAAHVEGLGTIASGGYQHVSGKYNIEDTNDDFAEIIGNGTGDAPANRSNARSLTWDGDESLAGNIYVKDTVTFHNHSNPDEAEMYTEKAKMKYDASIEAIRFIIN